MSEKYDAIIIGAGIGGLTCGCYLAKAGLKVLIVEQHDKPGGYCGSFLRNGTMYDTGAHYLGGIKKGILGTILNELNLRDRLQLRQFESAEKIVLPNTVFYIKSNISDTIQGLKAIFPRENKNIDSFFKLIFQENYYSLYRNVANKSFQHVLNQFFKNEDLLSVFDAVSLINKGLNASKVSAMSVIILMRDYISDPGYYPVGGMCCFPNLLVQRFKEGGGSIIFSEKVIGITTTNETKVSGIITQNNKFLSDVIISNCDAKYTFEELLNIETKEKRKIDALVPSVSAFVVYLQLLKNDYYKTLTNDVHVMSYFFTKAPSYNKKYEIIKGQEIKYLTCAFPADYDKTAKMGIRVITLANYYNSKYWDKYKVYFAEKILKKIKIVFPKIAEYTISQFIATPNTFKKFTLNNCGAAFGWASTVKQESTSLCPSRTSIKGLYLSGHWSTSAIAKSGVPVVAYCGKNTAKTILEDMNKLR